MKGAISIIGAFLLGVAAGVGGTYYVVKKIDAEKTLELEKKIRQECQDKINKIVKEAEPLFDGTPLDIKKKMAEKAKEKEPVDKVMRNLGYSTESPCKVIPETEAAEPNDYEEIAVSWFNDDVVFDDSSNEVIEGFDDIIGIEGMDIVRNCKEDGIYIANDERNEMYYIKRYPDLSYTEAVENGVIDVDEDEE